MPDARRRPEFNPESQAEIHQGSKPGTRYARMTRVRERRFERGDTAGTIRATEVADMPRSGAGRVWRSMKRTLVGAPLASSRLTEERLSKVKALAIFSSDALSSTAYATEEILLILVLAGAAALTYSIYISIAIAVLLVIVATSYRQTIRAYPNGGGAYKVAMDNLGTTPGLVAGASLVVDYTLTVAVSTAAGVAAITSAIPELHDERVVLAVMFVVLLTVGNLRGLREAGTIFAIPTYFFLVTFSLMIVVGLVRVALGGIDSVPHGDSITPGTQSITLFLILRAFSSGATALTGIEAISNGVPAFREPSPKNAATTLTWMAGILTVLFVSLTVLAHEIGVYPSESKTVVAQIAEAVFGGGPLFYLVQVSTALILVLAANTSFAGLPALASVMARDRWAPRFFTFRGDRLGYSHGIIALALASALLLVAYGADTHRLIPLYAVGVFVGFTLSQAGMVVHWRKIREAGWRCAMIINGIGAASTGVVAVIIAATKFTHGAWLTIIAIGLLALIFCEIGQHYRHVQRQLSLQHTNIIGPVVHRRFGQPVVIPIDELNRATARAVAYAYAISNNITAIHVTDDVTDGEALRRLWEEEVPDVPLLIVESEFRSLLGPVLSYIDALDRADPEETVTLILPEYRSRWPWQRILHNQSSQRLKKSLLDRPHTVVVEIPYHLE
ncbi:MAG: APC family permease [Chloroflexota bacterium]|nr:APC family permease [Chloroflexota bacterium]